MVSKRPRGQADRLLHSRTRNCGITQQDVFDASAVTQAVQNGLNFNTRAFESRSVSTHARRDDDITTQGIVFVLVASMQLSNEFPAMRTAIEFISFHR